MPKHSQRHLPIDERLYKTTKLVTQFSPIAWDKLRFRALNHHASPEGFIKQILNKCIAANTLPPVEPFNAYFATTRHHLQEHHTLVSSYPIHYLQYLDNLIQTLPPIYTSNGRSRRRMVETLTLIDLFDYCDEAEHETKTAADSSTDPTPTDSK